LVSDRSAKGIRKSDVGRYYFANGGLIYSDKVSQFVCECDKASGGAVMRRLEQRFNRIYIDEIQDMWGYDLELIELILRSRVKLTLVGDHRQATFRTNNSSKNKASSGQNITKAFEEWRKAGLCTVGYEVETHRCNQAIADLGDAFFPEEPKTSSRNKKQTGHDGVFSLQPADVPAYIVRYRPQVLRLSRKTLCDGHDAKNFGECKGLTFDRVLVFPHKQGLKWLSTGSFEHIKGVRSGLYVGVTRARYSVAFVFDGKVKVPGIQQYNAE
jgi:DNA helicase II / ATP-dependent DNA helicase PcrA